MDETELADKDVRRRGSRAREREREKEKDGRTERRNGVREKKGSNSFSFSSLIRLVNRLFWRSRRSHNRATSLLGFRGEEANGNTATIRCSEASLFSSSSPPGCVLLDRPSRLSDMRACIRAKLHLRSSLPSSFARSSFSRCLSSSRVVRTFSTTRARVNVSSGWW